MSKDSMASAAAVADRVAHTADYMQQYTADLVDAVRKGAGGVGESKNFTLLDSRRGSSCTSQSMRIDVHIWPPFH